MVPRYLGNQATIHLNHLENQNHPLLVKNIGNLNNVLFWYTIGTKAIYLFHVTISIVVNVQRACYQSFT